MEEKSEQVAGILRGIRGATDVGAIKIGGQTELNIVLNRERMARYGIKVSDVNATLQTAFAGDAVNVYYEGDRRFDVTLRLDKGFRDGINDVADLPVNLPSNHGHVSHHIIWDSSEGLGTETIPLGAIADVQVRQGAGRIRDRKSVV